METSTMNISTTTIKPIFNPDSSLSSTTSTQSAIDPCNSYVWSTVYLSLSTLSLALIILHLATLIFKNLSRSSSGKGRRQHALHNNNSDINDQTSSSSINRSVISCGYWSTFDLLFVAFFVSAIIQYGPMLAQVFYSGHNLRWVTQTGCKLLFYTEYGMRHVIAVLVICFTLHPYLILYHNFSGEVIDKVVKKFAGWIVLGLFGIEGVFGMVPAIYVDISPANSVQAEPTCIWTPTLHLSNAQIAAMEMILRPITPYLIPLAMLAYPLFRLMKVSRNVSSTEVTRFSSQVQSSTMIVVSYFVCNLPYVVILLIESAQYIQADMNSEVDKDVTDAESDNQQDNSWIILCNFKWVFFLLHQCWFLIVPVCAITHHLECGLKPLGLSKIISTYKLIKEKISLILKRF